MIVCVRCVMRDCNLDEKNTMHNEIIVPTLTYVNL